MDNSDYKLISIWKCGGKMQAIVSKDGKWFLVARAMQAQPPALFKIKHNKKDLNEI